MGMAADHRVDSLRAAGQLSRVPGHFAGLLIHVRRQVRQHHDHVRALRPNYRNQFPHHRRRVAELERRYRFRAGRVGRFRRDDADHGDFQAEPFQHRIRLHKGHSTLSVLFPDIRRNVAEIRLGDPLPQLVQSPVELMVAERHGIELQGVQDFHDGFSIQQVGIRTALKHVAGADKNAAVGVFRPLAAQERAEFGGARIAPRFDQCAVKIIDSQQVDPDDSRPFFGGSHARPRCQTQQADQQ